MNSFIKLLQTRPVAFKNDPVHHIKNLMRKFIISELPVIDENNLLGTITAKNLIYLSKKTKIENLLAYHMIEKDYIALQVSSDVKELVSKFFSKEKYIACVFDSGKFVGYVQRKKVLELLTNVKEKIVNFISKECVCLDYDDNITKLIKNLKGDLPILVLKDGMPFTGFSPDEVYRILFISGYADTKIGRDFETLRGEKRKLLKFRIDKQLLRRMKESMSNVKLPQIKIGDLVSRKFTISEEENVSEAAKMMLKYERSALATENGVLTDLNLLKVLV